ncbi:MAG: FlgK, partial [Clostridia bacterium]|nr:FlgK [Clostridia bacterium]
MRSTFYGFEIARSALQAGQTGLDVTGQNISNTNTEGYSRQAVDQKAVNFSNSTYKYIQLNTARVGQGVSSGDIIQIRDQFLDIRYRNANSEYNTLSTSLSILKDVENIFDESQNDGLNAMLGDFYTQLSNLSANAGDIEFSTIFRASANKVVQTLNQYSDQLSEIKSQEMNDLKIIVDDINTLTNKIDNINNTIKNEKLQGNPSNELLDERNLYIDKLSDYLNITVENNQDGTVSLKSGNEYLLDADAVPVYKANLSLDSTSNPIKILNGSDTFVIEEGQIKGYLQSLNGIGAYAAASDDDYAGIQYYQKALDDFSKTFADTFNNLNSDLIGINKPLFDGNNA